jgi:PAS domain S-box-containing protein
MADHSIKQYFQAFFEQSPYGCVLAKWDGSFVRVNQAYADILNRTVEETQRLSYKDVTPEEYFAVDAQQIAILQRDGKFGPFYKKYITKSGKLIQVQLILGVVELGGETVIWSVVWVPSPQPVDLTVDLPTTPSDTPMSRQPGNGVDLNN